VIIWRHFYVTTQGPCYCLWYLYVAVFWHSTEPRQYLGYKISPLRKITTPWISCLGMYLSINLWCIVTVTTND
jgi:hypothetical protein